MEEEQPRDDLPSIFRPKEPKNFDLFNSDDYVEVLKEKIPRPFIFGPIEFEDLDEQQFPAGFWHENIIQTLLRSPYIPAEDILIHGFAVTVKNQTLKRAS